MKNDSFRIGNLELNSRVFLAPMAGVNDIAFRILCKKAGAGLVYTGMINPRTEEELNLSDKPALQIFCNSEINLKEFVKKYEEKVSLFDFNLGCPAKVARECGFGAYMHTNLEMIERILKTIKENTKKPLTIKIRKSRNVNQIIKIAEKYCDAICLHARTLNQGYSGKSDLEYAEKIKKKIKIPLIYSGDVDENNLNEILEKFDFVMIGRKAMGNPNIFSKLSGKETKFSFKDYLEIAEKEKLKFSQIKFQAMNFTRNNENAREMRERITRARTLNEIKKITIL